MYYSGSLTVQSHKMVKLQVVPEKSDEVFDLTGESRDTAVCIQQQRGTEGCGVQRNNNV